MLKEEYKNVNADDFTALYELNKRVRELEKELEAERKKNASLSDIINRFMADNPEIPPADKVKAIHIGRGEGKPAREYVPVIRCEDCKFWKFAKPDAILGLDHGTCTCEQWQDSEGYLFHTTSKDFCSYGKTEDATP